jgi:hypothetical protein
MSKRLNCRGDRAGPRDERLREHASQTFERAPNLISDSNQTWDAKLALKHLPRANAISNVALIMGYPEEELCGRNRRSRKMADRRVH